MRKILGLSLSIALGLTALAAVPASADGAVVIKNDGYCTMAGVLADGSVIGSGAGERTTVVENKNWVHQTCKAAEGVLNATGKTQHVSDFPCLVKVPSEGGAFIFADKSHATVTKKGRATLTCSLKMPLP